MRVKRGRWPLMVSAVAVLYGAAAYLSYHVTVLHGGASTLWAPAGIGLAAVVLLGRGIWPGITVGELVAALIDSHGHHPGVAVAWACEATLEALVAGTILQRAHFNPSLRRIRDVLWLLIGATFLPAALAATIATAAAVIGTPTPASEFASVWRAWWLGDVTGIIVLTPLLVTAATYRPRRPAGLRALELAAFLVAICLLIAFSHAVPGEVAAATPAVLIWSALRFGPPGAALAAAVTAGVGVSVTRHAINHWHWLSPVDRLLLTQELFSIAALATLVLAAALEERARLLAGHTALGRFATDVANEVAPEELIERLRIGGAEILGVPLAVIEGAEPPADPVNTPIDVGGKRWGWLTLPGTTNADVLRRFLHLDTMLPRFAELLGVGIANTRAREALTDLATTDPLTGLANHRVFHDRLADEMNRAKRYGRPVAVAMIDIDHFKVINDSVGHVGGDKVLTTIAARVKSVMRNDSVVARLGGDEIAVILPESSAHGATIAVQRARIAVSGTPVPPAGTVTLSAGICDSSHADTPERIMELADDALYWSKLHGRDTAVAYAPDLVKPMTQDERQHRLTRTRALVGLKALARMIDARAPGFEEHSERVAEMAVKLARAAGWQADHVEALREAASVHDVGKLTLDELLITKRGERTRVEDQLWHQHPELGAQMTADVLDGDQTNWIRWHHERADGDGYPSGLTAHELPEGAALLAIANAWDREVYGSPARPPHSPEEALATIESEAGTRFTSEAVTALQVVLGAGAPAAAPSSS